MTELATPLILTETERRSELWQRLYAHFSRQLDTLRMQNDQDKDEVATAHLRGKIAQLKVVLALNEPPRIDEF
jgi:hypothetical protein